MKKIISLILTLAMAMSYAASAYAGDYDLTADEVKEMYESRMLLSRQDICDKILGVEITNLDDPLSGTKKVSEYIKPEQALIYTAQSLDDDFEEYEVYCIHAWDNDEDRKAQQNVKYIEIPVDAVGGQKTDNPAFITSYYINHEDGTFEGEVDTHGLPVRETNYEEMAERINKYNDKGKVTDIFFQEPGGYIVTVNGIDYRVVEKSEYRPYNTVYGLRTEEELTNASLAMMDEMFASLDNFVDQKRALTPNLSEIEFDQTPVEETHYIDEYKNAPAPFADVEDESKNMIAAVALLKDKGIINGFEDNTFRPDNTLTRGEAAAILAKLVRGEYDAAADFPDTENHWSRGAVNYLVSADIIHGYEDGLFRPDKDISYYEAVNLVMSIMGYTSFMFNEKTMETAMNFGFLDGLGSFTNEMPIPRIEFVRLIANAYDKNMYVVKVNFEARRPSFEFLADITLGQYYEGKELVNGILFHTPTACQQWQNDYEDEYYILYDSILDEEEKEIYRINKAKRQ